MLGKPRRIVVDQRFRHRMGGFTRGPFARQIPERRRASRQKPARTAALPHSVTKPASGPDQPGIFHTLLLQDEQDKELAATISFPNQRYEFQHQCVHLFPFSATNIQYPNRFPEHAESPLPGHAPIHASNAERGTP